MDVSTFVDAIELIVALVALLLYVLPIILLFMIRSEIKSFHRDFLAMTSVFRKTQLPK